MNLQSRIEKLEARLTNGASSKDAAVWLYEGPEEARTYWRAGRAERLSQEQWEAKSKGSRVHILLPDNGRDGRTKTDANR